ncbi:AraC family transcriptional regulator [Terrimonas sp. NA20]|uniref:AraC family transcriptional regulator n=1 Tax=Terrimonas ginsenosidimutans TaxID=2908004 RepID=A0ABS9KP06_9BACT|nr:helix-turn-helix domain-containing protein [Terrimonas ginsenosidimutans]MCG2614041.1 AraC family transcriptional regulator [Terrimonas ginsenosidimutans]
MAEQKIPVINLLHLVKEEKKHEDLQVERLESYLEKHYQRLHAPHRHTFYHLVLFTEGKGGHTIDFTEFTVKPFQVYFMIPGQVHSWHFKGTPKGYVINFSEQLLKSFLLDQHYLEQFSFFSGDSADCVCQLPVAAHPEAIRIMEAMLKRLNTGGDQLKLWLTELLLLIEEYCDGRGSIPASVSRQKEMLFRGFRRLIDQHYKTIRLPKEYADLLYVTPNHLNALCQEMAGKTAGELIRDRVMLESKRLLVNADLSIAQIAYELNFQDNSYFSRFFRKQAGVTPEAFRSAYSH